MRCMMLIGGILAFLLSGLNHCFVDGCLNFIQSWKMELSFDWVFFIGIETLLQFSMVQFFEAV